MQHRQGFRLSLMVVLSATIASASALAGSAPSLASVEDNVSYAAAAICAPYALDNVDRAALPIGHGLVQADGLDGLGNPNPTGVRVGMAGFVHVTFTRKPDGSRSCDIEARAADPQSLRKAALSALASRPERFAPTKSKYLPGRFATEDLLCAAPDSPHAAAFVMLSSPHPEVSARIAILLTLIGGGTRDLACDHDGVEKNYRTLVTR